MSDDAAVATDPIADKYPKTAELLRCLEKEMAGDELGRRWSAFRDDIEESMVELRTEFNADKEKWIAALFDEWIKGTDSQDHDPYARLAAIRLLGHVAGADRDTVDSTFEKLWEIAAANSRDVDSRSWALYSLMHCNLMIEEERWTATFGIEEGGWLPDVREAKVRAWAAFSLGELVSGSNVVACATAAKEKEKSECAGKLKYCRVDDALIPNVEEVLLDQWLYEIDREVKIRLVQAIGKVVGWGDVSAATIDRAIAILNEATGEFNTRTDIASAICQIAINAIRRPDISREEREAIVDRCVTLAVELTIALQERDGANETSRFGETYNQQREYILALYTIACTDMSRLQHSDETEAIVLRVTEGLFEIADGEALHKANPAVANDTRFLALYYLNRIADEDSTSGMSARRAMEQHAISRYKLMIGDPQEEIARTVVTNLHSLLDDDQEAAAFFVGIILNEVKSEEDPIEDAIRHRLRWEKLTVEDVARHRDCIRTRAAQAIASIPNNSAAHDMLVDALKEGNLAGSRARDALITMGGQKSVESIVEHSLQRQVEDRFFKPMEEASKRGWQLLGDVRYWSGSNYKYALNVAITTLVVGIVLLALGVLNLLDIDAGAPSATATAPSAMDWGLLVGGGLFTVLGFFGAYLWEPVKGLNKVAAELSQLIMSFENYLGRMRLIGLGFAHAYTTQNWGQLSFLMQISDLSAEAMRESIASLEDVGAWPDFDTDKVITVPLVVDQSVEDARNLLKQAKLDIEIGAAIYAADKDEGKVVTQEPPEGTFVARNTKVKVVPSTKQRPLVEVPDFRKKTIVEVTRMAQERGLTISGYRLAFDGSEEEAHVLEQDLKVGLTVGKDSALVLTIGKNGAGPA